MQSQEDTASEMRHSNLISARGSNFFFYFAIMGYILYEYYTTVKGFWYQTLALCQIRETLLLLLFLHFIH